MSTVRRCDERADQDSTTLHSSTASSTRSATAYGVPLDWSDAGLRRYGFHGTSHLDASRRAAAHRGDDLSETSLIVVHVGGGGSATAVRSGNSVATTMGLKPTDGMVMATRAGAVDPGLISYALAEHPVDVDDLRSVLDEQSGLMGLVGPGDAGEIARRSERGDERCRFALEVYLDSMARNVASVLPALERIDAIVLTGSVLESSSTIRRGLLDRLRPLGPTAAPAMDGRDPDAHRRGIRTRRRGQGDSGGAQSRPPSQRTPRR